MATFIDGHLRAGAPVLPAPATTRARRRGDRRPCDRRARRAARSGSLPSGAASRPSREFEREVETADPAAEKSCRGRSPWGFRYRHRLSPLHRPDRAELQGQEAQTVRGGGKARGGTENAPCVPPLVSLGFSRFWRGLAEGIRGRQPCPTALRSARSGLSRPLRPNSPTFGIIDRRSGGGGVASICRNRATL